jgi:hypothetical protein
MLELDILSQEFADAASAAWNRARQDANIAKLSASWLPGLPDSCLRSS